MPPILLIILDGWGIGEAEENNAIAQANTPTYDALLRDYPHSKIDASGTAVGLPQGIMGNSEVGHLNIGAGRIAKVGLTRIYQAIEDKTFFSNSELQKAVSAVKKNNSILHLMGLVSDGAVHSHQDHLYALLKLARDSEISRVAIHAFQDGRDTDPKSGLGFMEALQKQIEAIGVGQVATISGRYWAMDRDKRWDRIQKAYDAMVYGQGRQASDPLQAMSDAYAAGETDEFITPTVLVDSRQEPVAKIQSGDAVIFFNFRADRARELTAALTQAKVPELERDPMPQLAAFVCMAEYDKKYDLPVAFPPEHIPETLGEIVSRQGMKQLRIAETEKYAHVTFFFNGGEEAIFPGEERILVPSPREVATYDLKPEMSAPQITQKLLERLKQGPLDLIVLNFANADMVGHSGKLPAAIRAVETIDQQLEKILPVMGQLGGTTIITSDHGNCEKMSDIHGQPHTAHTTDLVPLILVGPKAKNLQLRPEGTLADIAPTILDLMGMKPPGEMSGRSMILH